MLFILVICTLLVYCRCFITRASVLHAPTFVAFAYIFFLLPQMFAFEMLEIGETLPNADFYQWTVLYAIACLGASYWGWHSGRIKQFYRFLCRFSDRVDRKVLFFVMLFVSALSNFAAYHFSQLSSSGSLEHLNGSQQLTGTGTKVIFLARFVYIPYAFFISRVLKKASIINILILVATISLTVQRVVLNGRRSPIALLILPVLCMLYFRKGFSLSKLSLVGLLIGPLVLIPALASLRYDFWTALFQGQIDTQFVSLTINRYFTRNYPYDFSNAVNIISLTSDRLYFGLGSGFWNDFVFNFVPAQFMGKEFKDFLYIKFLSPVSYLTNAELSAFFSYKLGTTQTGLGNTFAEFSFLGAACFFVQAKIMRTIWDAALSGKEFAMVVYCFMSTSILLSITHGFYYFINYGVLLAVVMFLCILVKAVLYPKAA